MVRKVFAIGLAVKDLDEAIRTFSDVFGLKLAGIKTFEELKMTIAYLPIGGGADAGGVDLELLVPTSPDTDLARFLERRGSGIYYITLEMENFDAALAKWKGRDILIRENPMIVSYGRSMFTHPKATHRVMFECVEVDHEKRTRVLEGK